MKAKEFREMTNEELNKKLKELKQEIVNYIERNALLWYLINVNLILPRADSGGQLWQVF